VTFPLLEKSGVKGDSASPFFKALTEASGQAPAWNFQKYLIGRDGKIIKVYPSNVTPEDPLLRIAIEAALAEKPGSKK
jgi:glutathione peroxidase